VRPILHLSIPVRDLDEAREFYDDALGCEAARRREGYQDVWFFGMRIIRHKCPDEAAEARAGSVRRFGVTLEQGDFGAITTRLARGRGAMSRLRVHR
jgi:uncharacterized protein